MDDWEAEDFVPPPPVISREQPKSPWEDEDQTEEEVKESWEEEEKPAATPAPKPKKKEDKKGKKATTTAIDDEKSSDPLAEKLRQQRLVEEADYQSTAELFGRQKNPEQTLENFIPKSEDDFIEYAELIATKIRPFEKSFHYMTLLKAVMKHAVTSLNAADAKVLATSLTVIANEKLKAEKEASGKKKTGAKKKQLLVDKAEDDSFAGGNYDEVDEYDFM